MEVANAGASRQVGLRVVSPLSNHLLRNQCTHRTINSAKLLQPDFIHTSDEYQTGYRSLLSGVWHLLLRLLASTPCTKAIALSPLHPSCLAPIQLTKLKPRHCCDQALIYIDVHLFSRTAKAKPTLGSPLRRGTDAFYVRSTNPARACACAALPTYVTAMLFFSGLLIRFDDIPQYWRCRSIHMCQSLTRAFQTCRLHRHLGRCGTR